MQTSIPRSQPIDLSPSTEMKVYGLFALAMGLTVVGFLIGMQYASVLFSGGLHFVLFLVLLAIVFTSRMWMDKSPLNVILFGAFPIITGITLAPYLFYVSQAVPNGNTIILNALTATTFMTAAAALFARTTSMNLQAMGNFLFMGLIGLIVVGLLQLFIPSLRASTGFELAYSGAGVLLFAAFTAYDFQRIKEMSRLGANPFMLALSLYLDIYNLFLMILRFMVAMSGNRR